MKTATQRTFVVLEIDYHKIADMYLRRTRVSLSAESISHQRLSALLNEKATRGGDSELGRGHRMLCWGTRKRAAHGLYRPTHERPAADSPSAEPTERWCSDSGKERANVTGKSARSVGLHPSRALGLHRTEAGMQMAQQQQFQRKRQLL